MTQFFIGLLLTMFLTLQGQTQKNIRTNRTHVFRESIPQLSSRIDILRHSRMCSDYNHEVIFVVKQKNMNELSSFLHDVSDPLSDNYGQHMTARAVTDLTSNPEGRDSVVEYLHATGATVVAETLGGEYITATAPITVWEKMFDCEFYMFHHTQENDIINKVVRTESYSVPVLLNNHVESVFNTIEMPHENVIKTKLGTAAVVQGEDKFDLQATSFTTLPKLRNAYNMGNNTGSNSSTQCIYAALNQYYSPDDLSEFQTAYGLKQQRVSTVIGGHESSSFCISNPSSCIEANLDVQYIMAASPVSPTTFWYTDTNFFTEWLTTVANTPNPPLVFSISYGAEETAMTASVRDAFNTQAMKLGAMGVTLVAASGDDGAISSKSRKSPLQCRYAPLFPASSPYVTSVGATMGIETGTTEVAASSGNGASITSGGGFSALHSQPSFQKDVVAAYFSTAAAAGQSALAGYSTAGRGFPDVSLAGENYVVLVGGSSYTISGTSASAPVMAGFISNINAARIAAGKGSVGWVNPTLYTNASMFINDITSGDNKCGAQAEPDKFGCCTQGFTCTTGWDPVTGLGSVNYGEMKSLFLSLGVVNGLNLAPLKTPIAAPTAAVKGAPTMEPTINTQSGPQEPSLSPSPSPSKSPLRTPKETQSRTPTISKGPPHTSPFSFPSLSSEGPSKMPISIPSRLSTASPTQKPTQTSDSKSKFQCTNTVAMAAIVVTAGGMTLL